ncbi:MAG: hypothetical protein NT123_24815, partial [Proteobacteria bacterium]|nr:hypothetical protein [Pseudomonadota bacterium]
MAKVTLRDYQPDDPIFKSGPQVFVPASRPSTESSQSAKAGTKDEQADSDNAPDIPACKLEEIMEEVGIAQQTHGGYKSVIQLAAAHPESKGLQQLAAAERQALSRSTAVQGDTTKVGVRRSTAASQSTEPSPPTPDEQKGMESNSESLRLLDEIMQQQ